MRTEETNAPDARAALIGRAMQMDPRGNITRFHMIFDASDHIKVTTMEH
jgi:hypothetical protein